MIKIDLTDVTMNALGAPSKEIAGKVVNIAKDMILTDPNPKGVLSKVKGLGKDIFLREASFANLTLMDSAGKVRLRFANSWVSDILEGVFYAPTPTLSFTREKQINATAINGSDSEVVESFGTKAYTITISGILVDASMHYYPKIQLRKLRELFEINEILTVSECELMDDLNIQSLYLSKIQKLNALKDYNDTFEYQLEAKSIKPVEFFM